MPWGTALMPRGLVKKQGRAWKGEIPAMHLPGGPVSSLTKAKSPVKETQMDLKKHTFIFWL